MRLTNRRTQHGEKIELSMTSMIDVVFLLLIFFMTTASFVKTERQLDSNIKNQDSSSSSASDLEPAIVDIVSSGGRFVFRVGAREIRDAEELTGILRQFPSKLDGAYVKVSDEAPFGMVAAAIQSCKDADFTTVTYVPPK
jgi:biopolymer transport protein ExbD